MELLLTLGLALLGTGVLVTLITKLLDKGEEAIIKSENKWDDLLLQFRPQVEIELKKLEEKLKVELQKKLDEEKNEEK